MSLERAISDGAALLAELAGSARETALAKARELAERYPELKLHLLPERDEYTKKLDYSLLIRTGNETIYLAWRSASATPWLLHQVHDFREGVLLRVDDETLTVARAVATLDELLSQSSIQERLVDACLVNRELKRRQPPVSDDELQAAVDEFRRRRGLLTLEATEQWMRAHGMSHARLEELARAEVRLRKLRRQLCDGEVERWFATHRRELERAALIKLRFANAELARRALVELPSKELFFARATGLIADDLKHGQTMPRLSTVVVTRAELSVADAELIFSRRGAVVGPLSSTEGAHLAYVASIEPAQELDATTRELVERRLFAAWLERERARATVEWNWGQD